MSDIHENFNSQCVKALKVVLYFSYITIFNATNFLMTATSVGHRSGLFRRKCNRTEISQRLIISFDFRFICIIQWQEKYTIC